MDAGGTFQRLKSSPATMCSFLSLSNIAMLSSRSLDFPCPSPSHNWSWCRANTVKSGTLNIAIAMPLHNKRRFLSFFQTEMDCCSAHAWTKCPHLFSRITCKWTKCPLATAAISMRCPNARSGFGQDFGGLKNHAAITLFIARTALVRKGDEPVTIRLPAKDAYERHHHRQIDHQTLC